MTFQQTQQTNGALHNPTLLVPFRELATQLYDLRKKLGLNQPEMGKLLNVSGPSISMWERGNPPHGPNLEMLRKFLDQNWSEVMGHGMPRQETITFDDPDAPKQFVLHREDDAPLRFTGFRLGSVVLFSSDTLHLYKTKAGTIVWADSSDNVNHGSAEYFVEYWYGSKDAGVVFTLAHECGLEIFEDIE